MHVLLCYHRDARDMSLERALRSRDMPRQQYSSRLGCAFTLYMCYQYTHTYTLSLSLPLSLSPSLPLPPSLSFSLFSLSFSLPLSLLLHLDVVAIQITVLMKVSDTSTSTQSLMSYLVVYYQRQNPNSIVLVPVNLLSASWLQVIAYQFTSGWMKCPESCQLTFGGSDVIKTGYYYSSRQLWQSTKHYCWNLWHLTFLVIHKSCSLYCVCVH